MSLLIALVCFGFSGKLPAQNEPAAVPGVVSLQGGKVNPQSHWGTVVRATADGQRLVTRSSRSVQVWNLNDSTLESEFPSSSFRGNPRFSLTKNRSRAFTFSANPTTRETSLVCMSLPERKTIWSKTGKRSGPLCLAPDESILAYWNKPEQALEIVECGSGEQLLSLNRGRKFQQTFDLAFSPSGNLIAPTTLSRELVIWNLENGDWQLELPFAGTRLRQIEFLDEGSLIFAGHSFTPPDTTTWHLKRISTSDGETLFDIGTQFETEDFDSFALSKAKKRLVTIHASKLMVWDLRTGRLEREIDRMPSGPAEPIGRTSQGAALSPDGQTLYLSVGKSLQTWDLESGTLQSAKEEKHAGRVNVITTNRDQTLIATGGADGKVLLWDGKTGQLLRELADSNMGIHAIEFLPETQRLAVVGDYLIEGRISSFLQSMNCLTGETSQKIELFGQQHTLAVSRDGSRLYATASEGPGNSDDLFDLAPGGDMYGGVSEGPSKLCVTEFDARTLETVKKYQGPIGGFNRRLRLQPNPKELAFLSNSQVRWWSLTTGKRSGQLSISKALPSSQLNEITTLCSEVDFARESTYTTVLVSSRMRAEKHAIVSIDSSNHKVRWGVKCERVPRNLLLSPNGRMLVVSLGGGDSLERNTILLLSPEDGKELFRFNGGSSPISSLQFSSDSRKLLGGRMIGDFVVWDLNATAMQARGQ
ncbi:MAG: WD40 repeat domain-containing protein [Pirellulaceae bacterium]